jgi:hypothetical protein
MPTTEREPAVLEHGTLRGKRVSFVSLSAAQRRKVRVWANARGYVGTEGGWIMRDGRPVCQGWSRFAGICFVRLTQDGVL